MQNNLDVNIRKIFPNLNWKKSKFISAGWDHDILMLDNKYVARIPKNNDARKRIMVDFYLLSYLQNKISADIPVPLFKDIKSKIAVYSVVVGSPMSEAKYKKMSISEKDKFAKNIALFLSQIHNTPIDIAQKCHIPNPSIIKQNQEIFEDIKFLNSYITSDEKKTIVNFVEKRKFVLKGYMPTLIHGDLTSDNIFIDKNTNNRLGIIDFSDAIISDPARDFASLFFCGEKFVNSVLKYYQATAGSNIFESAEVYYQDMAIKLLALAFKGSKFITKKDAKELFHKRLKTKA